MLNREKNRITTRTLNYLFAPTLLPENSRNPEYDYSTNAKVFGSIMFPGMEVGSIMAPRYYTLRHAYGPATTGFVRCVKD